MIWWEVIIMAIYTMHFYLDNGETISTPELEAESYEKVFETFYKVNDSGMINIESDTESLFIPVNKISKIKVSNNTELSKALDVGFISF